MSISESLFAQAKQYIPGGVNSPVRAFHGVDGSPIFIKSAQGAYLTDVDDKHYIDFIGSWGPMILGHRHPEVIAAIEEALQNGISFGAPTEVEIKLAARISALMPNLEMVRMVNSGTEATMSAIRLARAFTKRKKILKFNGCYHGHSDSLLVKAGSGALTLGVPSSPGVPAEIANLTLSAEFNDLDSVSELFERFGDDIAAIIVEPIPGNMGCILPEEHFLQGLRDICDHYQSVLIFDEVMTGFRVALGGAQGLYNIRPDLTTLGKIIGGGMPVGAFGGSKEIMEMLAPSGSVYQAGTLSGNPLAMTAGLATLEKVAETHFYQSLAENTSQLVNGILARAESAGISIVSNHVGGMFGLFFTDAPKVNNFKHVMQCDVDRFKRFFHAMLAQGIYFAPSAYESGFVSSAHQAEEINLTHSAMERALITV